MMNCIPRLLGRVIATCGIAALAFSVAPRVSAADAAAVEDLKINQLQFIGTHNSYHIRDSSPSTRQVREWSYSHAPLDVQLDRGVRSFELDLHDREGVFEVFHVPLLDEGTTCRRLAEGLATVRKWSDAHPRHLPISFLFELKKDGPGLDRRVREVDAAALDRLDELLRSAFAPGQIITPDFVRGDAATLREAVQTTGWPSVAASRDKVFFILHDDGSKRDLYTRDHSSLRGRVMFVRSDDTRDDGATLVLDNPRSPQIPRLAKAGYFIRTRADSDLRTASPGQPARRDASLASGAQIISTDYPTGERAAESAYIVAFPSAAPARVSPVNGPEALRGQTIGE
jgi:hypothetical protein